MYHSITFCHGEPPKVDTELNSIAFPDSRNTWEDWHLIPASRPTIAHPGVSTSFVEIPGRSGALDLSTYLTGGTVFGQRSGTWEFYVDNDHEYWETIRSRMVEYLHGNELYVMLEDVPTWYWKGRFSVDSWSSDKDNSRVNITYALDPYCYCVYSETDDWLWDPFNFETDYTDGTGRTRRL